MPEPKPVTPSPEKKPIGDPPNKEKPRSAKAGISAPQQFTLEPGNNGRGDGPLHREPLVKGARAQAHYGPGTYGNDQFAAEHHDEFVDDRSLPEGLCDPQGGPERPTRQSKEARYGRIGDHGKG